MGLSIVRAIANAHQATIESHVPPAGGLTVIVTFPPLSDNSTATAPEHRATSAPPHPAQSEVRQGRPRPAPEPRPPPPQS
jgi:hypothetical protein